MMNSKISSSGVRRWATIFWAQLSRFARSGQKKSALRFTRKLYRPDNAIFFAYGDIDFKKLVKLIRKALADDDSGKLAENAANSVGKLAEEKLPQISQITQISGDENSITTEKSVSSAKSVDLKIIHLWGKRLPDNDCDAEEYASGSCDDWNPRLRCERQPQNAALSAQQYAGQTGNERQAESRPARAQRTRFTP